MVKLIIGIAGENGAGKTTWAEFLKEAAARKKVSVERISSGDILAESLKSLGIEPTRENLQKHAVDIDKTFGHGVLSEAVRQRVAESKADIAVFDGMRWESDVEMIKQFENHTIIYITADAQIRWKRAKARNKKPGEDKISFARFLEEDSAPTETYIPRIRPLANIIFTNEVRKEVLKRVVTHLWEVRFLPSLR